MGLSFPGRVKRTEECWGQSRTINDGSPRTAAKTEEKPAGVNRRAPFAIPTVKPTTSVSIFRLWRTAQARR
jgi:hypothetical protein